MLRDSLDQTAETVVTDAGKLCFGVAAAMLTVAALGSIVNLFLTGWLAAGGFAVIGLLYLGMGLAQVEWSRLRSPQVVQRRAPCDVMATAAFRTTTEQPIYRSERDEAPLKEALLTV